MSNRRYTVCVDFDGVIHSYTSGWLGADVLPDPPNEGAIEWLEAMLAKFDVTILTTRGQYPEGCEAVTSWLIDHGLRPDSAQRILVTNEKCAALIYIDDRAWRFEGTFPTADQIHRALPWHKTAASSVSAGAGQVPADTIAEVVEAARDLA